MSNKTAKLLSTSSAADYLGITSQTLISYAVQGRIPASFFGRKWKFRAEDLDAFVASQRRGR
jgi:excisionase family DNA binding protein